jgi:hypothetical protein
METKCNAKIYYIMIQSTDCSEQYFSYIHYKNKFTNNELFKF